MKVILTAEVKGKGHEGDVVDVARGYAVNYLLPRKMAIQATPGNLKQLEARMANISKRNESRRGEAEGVAASINGKKIVIEAKSGDAGKLFGSVTTLMVEQAIAAQLDADVDHKRMDLSRPIKEIGEYNVVVSVYGDVKAELIVKVVPEGGAAALAAAEAAAAEAAEVRAAAAAAEAAAAAAAAEAAAAEGDDAAEADDDAETDDAESAE
ncbi:MAG: 50S ribosomal protein L9 [Coriobacteriia bacterium]|nr:50S ribosomal protein L9 [Coriobacteriia bacterium]